MHCAPAPPIPLIALATLGYVTGAYLGFAQRPVLAAGVVVATVVAAALRRRMADAGIVLALLAGVVTASAATRDDRACVRRLRLEPELGRTRWHAVLDASAAPGSYTPARLVREGCALRASLAVRHGSADPGATVQVTGVATVRGARLVVIKATVRPVGAPGLLASWRAASARVVDRVFVRDRALAQALLLADMRGIPRDVKDRYATSGLIHALSVSGLHVGIIAAVSELVLGLVFGANAGRVGTIVLVTIYVAMVGAPPPAVRAASMLGALAASRLLERPTTPWAALAAGALLPLHDPRIVLDLGYQLSVVGVASLVVAARVNERVFGAQRRWWFPLATTALTSAIATVASAPLVAYAIGRVSLIGAVSNVAAGPLFTIVQPMLFLGLLLSPIEPLARVVGDAAHVPLLLLDWVARSSAAVPFAAITLRPTLMSAALAGVATAAIFAIGAVRNPRPAIWVGAVAGVLLVWDVPRPGGSATEVHMLDVGQGDALVVRTRGGRWVVVDVGRGWRGGDAAQTTVLPHLRRYGGPVAALVLSHPHTDHIGGAATLLEALRPALLYDAGFVVPGGSYRAVLETARRHRIPWRRPTPGDSLVVDEVVLTFLAPDSAWTASLHDANDASIVMMLRVGARRMLLTGDAELAEEAWLLAHAPGPLRADVLKVGHHGSRTSSSGAFLAAVQPAAAIISVGAGNDYGHPSPGTLDALQAAGAHILRTDQVGTIIVRTDGRFLSIQADGATWRAPD